MLLYALYVLAGGAYFNIGLDETFKAKESKTLKKWEWWMWFGILVLPIWKAGKFSALNFFRVAAYPALRAREQRMLDAKAEATEEPTGPKLLAYSTDAAERAAKGLPDPPDPEPDLEPDKSSDVD